MAELVALIYGERRRHVKRQLPSLSVPKLLQMRDFAKDGSRGLFLRVVLRS